MKLLSVIVPCYNEEENIHDFYEELMKNSAFFQKKEIEVEVMYIDDGSRDRTAERVKELAKRDKRVHLVSFSRNFGKEAAIFAGLEASTGDCCLIMDCDLQHPAELIPEMYRLWQDGYEVVEGVKASRGKENFLHTLCANSFYHIISKASGIDMSKTSDFKLLDRKAVDSLLAMPERAPFFRALSSWIGFRTISIPFHVKERENGTSKWSVWKLIKYAIRNITSFSGAPLQFVTFLGWVMFLCSIGLGIQSLYRYFTGTALEGFTTVILLQLLIGSVLMISLGIIGHYISRIYDEIKARPRYLITKKCGF